MLLLLGGLGTCLYASSFTVSIPGDAIIGSPVPVGLASSHGTAFAGNGGSVGASVVFSASNGGSSSGTSTASSVIDDLVISGPSGTVQTGFKVPFSGIFGYTVENMFTFDGILATSSFTGDELILNTRIFCVNACGFGQFLNGNLIVRADQRNGDPMVIAPNQVTTTISQQFFLRIPISSIIKSVPVAGFDDSYIYGIVGFFDSGVLTVPTGVPLHMDLDLQVNTATTSGDGTSGNGFLDLSHTFGLPKGVPIFDLPPGFTANAPSIGLVDNMIAADAVPEPATFGLVGVTCLLAGFLRRAKRVTNHSSNPTP